MLNIFKSFTFTWWVAALFKVGMLSVGILLGGYFPKIFKNFKAVLWAIAAFSLIYVTAVWLKQ